MNGLIVGALMALSMVQQTDTILDVGSAERLHVETLGGSIEIGVWDEDRIRVQAEHSNRTFVEIERRRDGREIDIEAEARRGPANLVDFRITVPRRFALSLEANYGDIVINGSDGAVEAETVQGDVTVMGGRGSIQVEATIGSILVEGADGVIEIESSAADIRVVDSSGEIYAETAGGTIVLERVRPRAVDVGSTGGRVHYDGTFEPDGTYFFGAHGGSITIIVPENAAASFNVATVHGSITSNLSGQAESMRGGERHQFDVGGGGAVVEAETYGGRIRLLRPGSEGTAAPTPRRNRVRDDGALADGVWAWESEDGYDYDYEYRVDDADHDGWDWDWNWEWTWDRNSDRGGVAHLEQGIGARVAPIVNAEVGPRVNAEVAPRVAAEVSQALAAWVRGAAPRAETPTATIRRRVSSIPTTRTWNRAPTKNTTGGVRDG